MKKHILLLVGLFILNYGCSTGDIIEENNEITGLEEKALLTHLAIDMSNGDLNVFKKSSSANAVTRTIKFQRSSGYFDFVYPSTDCSPYLQVLIVGNGNATFLGNFEVINKYCFDGENPVGPIYGFLKAANGDEIFTQMIGATELPAPEISNFEYIILGGTGRFEGATGSVHMYGIIDRINFLFNLEGEGEITF
ncbi:hypothetical protein [Aegicerativicinus sediminis]|uniref:hypothetical protein n=1 Tax=Aegicerativicinus sediminis TaxID=2893202 RepID=UPI001E379CA3|nr:hypothetical protein [Aegicerativicinus sediminis]